MTENTTLTNLNLTTADAIEIDRLARRAPATDDLLVLADWLGTNGAAHLSPIERIELAERLITRRRFLIGAGALGLGVITGCGAEEQASAPPAASDTRIFVDDAGHEVEIPTNPQRIVTLNDGNTLPGFIELGAIDRIAGSTHGIENGQPVYRAHVNRDADTSSITPVGLYYEPNLERIAEVGPDLIVGPLGQEDDVLALYSEIAPTVQVQTFGVPLAHTIGRIAELIGAEDQVAELESRYQTALQQVRDRADDGPSEVIVSMIMVGVFADPSTIVTMDNGNTWQQTLKDIGFARPAEQIDDEERNFLSFELVNTQDGDLLLLLSFGNDEITAEEAAMPLTDSPMWAQLNAVQKGQAYMVPVNNFDGVSYGDRIAFLEYLSGLLEGLDTSGDLSSVEVAIPTAVEE